MRKLLNIVFIDWMYINFCPVQVYFIHTKVWTLPLKGRNIISSSHRASGQGRIFIVPYLLSHWISVSSEKPISSGVSYDKPGVVKTYSNLDPREECYVCLFLTRKIVTTKEQKIIIIWWAMEHGFFAVREKTLLQARTFVQTITKI